jgi:oxepin-CoA hydrolase / 3-oxo-5,6-dehydrosuberyl-CoA semialdehyde dehydrogenase
MELASYTQGQWCTGGAAVQSLQDATSGQVVAQIPSTAIDYAGALRYARSVGGLALRKLTFHERAALLKNLAKALGERKEELYALSQATGATKADCFLDVDGGLGTLFSYASRGARELPNAHVYIEGEVESLSKSGGFVGQHICVPLEGAAVHINAYNFPVWGLLEKFAPTFLAGVPVIAKPASATAYVAERLVKQIIETNILPEGALQLICGGIGDLFDHLETQDVVAFTGSAATAQKLRIHPAVVRNSVRFTAETDSLNAAILGPDAAPGTPEFDLFVAEVVREMKYKAGQRCTAIRRALVPAEHVDAVSAALKTAFGQIVVGDPRNAEVTMGPLTGLAQRRDVLARIAELRNEAELVTGDPEDVRPVGAEREKGAFIAPTLLRVRDAHRAQAVHSVEAFGPVCTLLPYSGVADAIAIAKRGEGSLVASVFTADPAVARELIVGIAPFHGRVLVVDRDCGKEQTGHGSPMPGLVHGGPGRAGGGEELGGIRAVLHYMQRTAVQGTPKTLAALTSA